MKKIYLSVVCLLISIPLIAQLYVEPEKEVECSVFLAKEGRGRAQQGLEIHILVRGWRAREYL